MSDSLFNVGLILLVAITIYHIIVKVLWKAKQDSKPHILVSSKPISIEKVGPPCGFVSIDGVRVKEGDTVVLTDQTDVSKNGIWAVSRGTWQIQSRNTFGSWRITSSGELWLRDPTLGHWVKVDPEERLIPLDSPDFAPNNPAEAAAYLLRLGVTTNQVSFPRFTCIETLVAEGFLSRASGDLLLAKLENLTTEVVVMPGVMARLTNQTWTDQVIAHMVAIQNAQEMFTRLEPTPVSTRFTSRPLVGFNRIHQEAQPQQDRRSRYSRDPVI